MLDHGESSSDERSNAGPTLRLAGDAGTGDGFAEGTTGATVAAAAQGDQAAWTRLVRAYTPRVFAMVRSRVRDPELAEEITQSVFATVARQLGGAADDSGYREQGRFEPWLFRVALNRVRDEARRRKRRAALQERIAVEPRFEAGSADEHDHPDALELGRLRAALEDLGEKDREIIELRHHAQMSFKQIAESLAEPVGTLLARHHRALRKLRDALASVGDAPDARGGETTT
ncbi:MAG: sigma-70 family RNA polymerase sigma factor [Planctomycetota bacterium]